MGYEHFSFLSSGLLNRAKTRACNISTVCCINFCIQNSSNPLNFFEHVNATQCVAAFADFLSSIYLHGSKCIIIFSNLCGYNQLQDYTHARIVIHFFEFVNTLCASLTMLKKKVATRRAGVPLLLCQERVNGASLSVCWCD